MLPVWMVLPPVALGIIAQAIYGNWIIAGAMVAAILLHLSEKLPVRSIGTLLLIAASLAGHQTVLAVGFGLYWILWETHIMGGADALAVYAALMIAPHVNMFWALLAGIFLWAFVAMVIVYRGLLFARVRLMVWRVMLRDLPKESEIEAEGKPTLGGLLLGVAIYMVWTGLLLR
jgi:Flp pilus assembly protein protease CpaA